MRKPGHIGILTGGGDVPGLNSVIKSVVYRATELGREVVGIRKGWEGLTQVDLRTGDDPRNITRLTRDNTRTIDRSGGTLLHTSRTNPQNVRNAQLPERLPKLEAERLRCSEDSYDLTPVVLDNLERLGIGTLITIGGDDTLTFSSRLHEESVGVVAVPKTMDNDVRGTEYCIGFSTAITRAKDLITRQRTTLGSHERIRCLQDLWSRRRLHRAVYRVRHFNSLSRTRVSVRARSALPVARRRQAGQSE